MMTIVLGVVLLIGMVAGQSTTVTTPQQNLRTVEAVRLVDGSNDREGRVEVLSNGAWGTVCDDFFGRNAAKVVCSSLGLESQRAVYVPTAFFGEGAGPILLDNTMCEGNETTLNQCQNNPIGEHNCQHDEDVGVVCDGWPITGVRLVNGTTAQEGRLEVQVSGRWGTVCDDGWSNIQAQVVCRTLGHPFRNAQAVIRAGFGEGHGPILLDDIVCAGDEDNLELCQVEFDNDCYHDEDVGVRCR